MPRTADHDARRRQVLDAVCRITVRGGLQAATFREVASEAGVSIRLVQYYFGSKAGLLAAANRHVLGRSATRLLAAVEALGPDAPPREVVRAAMRSFLPTDTEAEEAMVLFYAFYAARLTSPEPSTTDPDDTGAGLQKLFAHHIALAKNEGTVPDDVDPEREAFLLFLLLPSLASGAVDRQISLERAEEIVEYALTRVFGPKRPARRARR